MSNTAVKIASVLLVVLASTTASFARGGGSAGAGHSGGVRPNIGVIGAAESQMVDPSGIANANKVAPLPPPHITVPVVPKFK